MNTVRCNNCYWHGTEKDLVLIGIGKNKDGEEYPIKYETGVSIVKLIWDEEPIEYIKGCKNCLTDEYLTDLEEEMKLQDLLDFVAMVFDYLDGKPMLTEEEESILLQCEIILDK